MYYKINNEYYLDKNDVGKLITIKNNNFTNASVYNKHENCLILNISYSYKDKIRPSSINLLNQDGKILEISFYKANQIEIKFL